MSHDTWRMGFHLMPPTGWLNDPNGLCQLNGTYHVFFQYSPDWPAPHAPRGWGHFASDDLVSWRAVSRGFVIAPDTPDEASGAYSARAAEKRRLPGVLHPPRARPQGLARGRRLVDDSRRA